MTPAMLRLRPLLWWIAPMLLLGALLGFELGWGSQVHRLPEPPAVLEARPITPALLPEYKIEGGLAGRAETVSRTLFNPTRRPAPALVVEAARPQMQRGQFVLTGTSLAGDRAIAFLKEVAGGKFRTVRQGEQINGMLVAEVKPDRVRFTLGSDSEELMLKMAAGPKVTVAPAAPAPAPPGAPVAPGAVNPAARAQDELNLVQRRRQAAQAAAAEEVVQGGPPASGRGALPPGAPPVVTPQAPSSADSAWNDVYERMRQGGRPAK
jgi:hypothetical protein